MGILKIMCITECQDESEPSILIYFAIFLKIILQLFVLLTILLRDIHANRLTSIEANVFTGISALNELFEKLRSLARMITS